MDSKEAPAEGLHITEGIGGVWHYHLSEAGTNASGLCGARTMNTSILLGSWGTRGHLKETWCAKCATQGAKVLIEAGVPIAVIQSETNAQIEYSEKESFAVSRPPLEAGIYAVLLENGQAQAGVWNGSSWEGGIAVARYSGAPMLLSKDVRAQYRQNIRAGVEVPQEHEHRVVAMKSAMGLARHRAVKMAMAKSSEDQLAQIKEMVGLFTVARSLGVSFLGEDETQSNATDRSLFEWGISQIRTRDPKWFVRTESMVDDVSGIRSWLDGQPRVNRPRV